MVRADNSEVENVSHFFPFSFFAKIIKQQKNNEKRSAANVSEKKLASLI